VLVSQSGRPNEMHNGIVATRRASLREKRKTLSAPSRPPRVSRLQRKDPSTSGSGTATTTTTTTTTTTPSCKNARTLPRERRFRFALLSFLPRLDPRRRSSASSFQFSPPLPRAPSFSLYLLRGCRISDNHVATPLSRSARKRRRSRAISSPTAGRGIPRGRVQEAPRRRWSRRARRAIPVVGIRANSELTLSLVSARCNLPTSIAFASKLVVFSGVRTSDDKSPFSSLSLPLSLPLFLFVSLILRLSLIRSHVVISCCVAQTCVALCVYIYIICPSFNIHVSQSRAR